MEFLGSLPQPPIKTKFAGLFERLLRDGEIRNEELFRRLTVPGDPPVWEWKVHLGPGYRLFGIQHPSGDWYATHGRAKPKPSQVRTEADRARRIYKERRSA